MATTKASKAEKDAEAVAEAEQAALEKTLGSLIIHEGTGVALDTEDPNYEQLKRMEDIKTEIQRAKLGAIDAGYEEDDKVRQAALDAEEAKLRAILAQAQNAAKGSSNSSVVEDLATQKAASEAAEKAATGTDGK